MPQSVERMIEDILKREGGFVNHPADRGGPTRFGITQKTLSGYLRRPATIDEVQRLSPELATEIYRCDYFVAPRLDTLPERIQPFAFDSAVNHGPARAVRFVQQVCNAAGFGPIDVDGVCGPETRGVAAEADRAMGPWLLAALVEERRNFYHLIVAGDPAQEVFVAGWLNRVKEFWPADLPELPEAA
ncbi:MAG: glycoside hydrolase family 108 protein [Geminicoccaceae bacterium]